MSKILIIDDDEPLLEMFQEYLEDIGHSHVVLRASNVKAALRLFQDTKPDLVMIDVVMPEIDGFELLRRFKETGHSFKSIVISGLNDDKCEQIAEELGAEEFLLKPIDLENCKGIIQRLLKK